MRADRRLGAGAGAGADAAPGGFWKCRTTSTTHGEFGGEDPVGLAAHVHIPTNCAIAKSDGHGKIYCFSSIPSLDEFETNLDVLPKAQAFWARGRVPDKM